MSSHGFHQQNWLPTHDLSIQHVMWSQVVCTQGGWSVTVATNMNDVNYWLLVNDLWPLPSWWLHWCKKKQPKKQKSPVRLIWPVLHVDLHHCSRAWFIQRKHLKIQQLQLYLYHDRFIHEVKIKMTDLCATEILHMSKHIKEPPLCFASGEILLSQHREL